MTFINLIVSVVIVILSSQHLIATTAKNIRNPFEFQVEVIQKKTVLNTKPIKKQYRKKVASKPADIVLNGIFVGNENSYVLINQELLLLGDIYKGWTISDIEESQVLLRKGHNKRTLSL